MFSFSSSPPAYKFQQIGPIYYEYGSLIITYDKADIAVKAFYKLRDSSYPEQKKDEKEDKNLLVLLLPSISDAYLDPGVKVCVLPRLEHSEHVASYNTQNVQTTKLLNFSLRVFCLIILAFTCLC